jgi:steroid delta-isomerase-like uncharacterized protein
MNMTTTDPEVASEEAVHGIFRDLFERRDLSDPYRYWTDQTLEHFVPLGVTLRGAKELTEFFRGFLEAMPDAITTVENVVVEDRNAVVQWTMTRTLPDRRQEVEPSGNQVTLRGCDVFRLYADGRVAENTVYYDSAELLRLGAFVADQDRTVTENR